jgi:hypothetical protein
MVSPAFLLGVVTLCPNSSVSNMKVISIDGVGQTDGDCLPTDIWMSRSHLWTDGEHRVTCG